MNKQIDYTQLNGLGVSQDMLDFMQQSYTQALSAMANLIGPLCFVYGCAINGGNIAPGWVAINGVLMPFVGGTLTSYIYIDIATGDELFYDGSMRPIDTTKVARLTGVASGNYAIANFVRLPSLAEMAGRLVSTGFLQDFAGPIGKVPNGWLGCDGSSLNIADYPALFAVIGNAFGGDGTTTFFLPDFTGKTAVGMLAGDDDFGTLGQSGGVKSKTLLTANIPPLSVVIAPGQTSTSQDGSGRITMGGDSFEPTGITLSTGGTSTPFSILNPYLVITKIIKT